MLRSVVRKQTKAQGLGRLPYDMLVSEFSARLDDLVKLLADTTFFYADIPSILDFATYGQLCNGSSEGITPDFKEIVDQRTALSDWRNRLEQATGKSQVERNFSGSRRVGSVPFKMPSIS